MRPLLITMLLLGSVLTFGQSRPNVVFILTDDLGYSDLGCYGNPFNETPFIDSLAKRGIKFTSAYAASPVCSPSRASLLTGKHPARHKITNYLGGERKESDSPVNPADYKRGLPNKEFTLAELFRQQNYATAMVGKWHLGGAEEQMPWNQGFQNAKVIGKNGLDYYNYGIFEDSYKKEFLDSGSHYLTDKLTQYSIDFIKSAKDPFFLYLAYSAPHVLTVPRADKLGKYLWKYEKFGNAYNPNYAAMLESVDDGVGQILAALKQKGVLENTIIVFTSDNGGVAMPELGPQPTSIQGLNKWKGHVYEGGIKIPTLVSWPAELKSQVSTASPMLNTDWFNTFSEIIQGTSTDSLDSKSALNILKNPEKLISHEDMFWHYPHFSNQLGRPAAAYRQGDWKLIKSYETSKLFLFNLASDPAEKNNLALKNPKITSKLNMLLESSLTSLNANRVRKK